MPLPGQPSAVAHKKGRVQSQDPEKTTLGKNAASQLLLAAANRMRQCARVLCGRTAEAPWLFQPYDEQQLGDLLVRALLQMPEFAGEPHAKVVKAIKL